MRYSGRIFDGVSLWENAEIEIDETSGLIEYIEDVKNVEEKYKGLTFLPGLIDTHMHFFGTASYSLFLL